ncbi:MAG: hypothetical protein E6Q40_00915 [Cupriavidus sp.]|nr:MAG: hypothetical protein E6Q40_00915 [Cupriavidus sp.]
MSNLLFYNDNNLILDSMRFDADQSVINDAVLVAHFFKTTTGDTKAITGVSNAGPIVITSAGHGLSNGEKVVVLHVLGNTAANGCWTVANVTTDTFELAGSVGNGLYNRGGDWYRAVTGAHDLSMVHQVGSNGKYLAVVPYSIDRLPNESCRLVILCSNYNYQMERDHSVTLRQ